jgi:hypothetical protein
MPVTEDESEALGATRTELARRGFTDWVLRWVAITLVPGKEPDDFVMRRKFVEMAEAIRDRLAGERPTPIEALLAEQCSIAWLAARRCELQRDRVYDAGKASLKQHEFFARRADQAERRYVQTLKALASVRKLDLHAVQVNVDAYAGLRAIADRYVEYDPQPLTLPVEAAP